MITRFKDEYRWLSNFAEVSVEWEGSVYSSVENAYQAAKSMDESWRVYCATENRPGKVKKASRRISVREDWEEVKIGVMKALLEQKFSKEPYMSLLIETGNTYIIEGNNWGDTFWGVDLTTGEGYNVLGNLIMDIRRVLTGADKLVF